MDGKECLLCIEGDIYQASLLQKGGNGSVYSVYNEADDLYRAVKLVTARQFTFVPTDHLCHDDEFKQTIEDAFFWAHNILFK